MSGIDPNLVQNLVSYARSNYPRLGTDELEDILLDHAAEAFDFDGDFDELWDDLREALAKAPAPRPSRPSRPSGRGSEGDFPKADPWDAKRDPQLATAPFRFVPLNEKVLLLDHQRNAISEEDSSPAAGQQVDLDDPGAGRHSCILDVDWRVETPLLIGEADRNGVHTPFRLGSEWAIPGATLRGCIRSVLEIAAFGRLFQVNRHQRFALRDFQHPDYKAFMQRGQNAGWLRRVKIDEKTHVVEITPCKLGYVRITDLLGTDSDAKVRGWISSDRKKKYSERGIQWRGEEAFSKPASFRFLSTDDKQRPLYLPEEHGASGQLVVSGRVPTGAKSRIQKFFEYAFIDDPDAVPYRVSDAAWDTFEITHCKPSANKRTPDGAWKEFERTFKEGGRIPVFWTGDLDDTGARDFSFGLTRLYRIPHRNSIGDLIARTSKAHRPAEQSGADLVLQPDFVEHLFGYVYEPGDLLDGQPPFAEKQERTAPPEVARKGRVAFGFARPRDPKSFTLWPADGPVRTILGAPKPAFAPFYLVGHEKDYGAPDAQLAGRKRYLPRRRPGDDPIGTLQEALEAQANEKVLSEDVWSKLRFLAPRADEAVFRSRIRLHNVTKAEIGAVLWALTFGGDATARHLIGRAKAFGAGQLGVAGIGLKVRPNGPTDHRKDVALDWRAADGRAKLEPWLNAFEDAMKEIVPNWSASPEVSALLRMSQPVGWTAERTTYLSYTSEKGQGGLFRTLRRKTGLGAGRLPPGQSPPVRLLE